MTYWRVRLTDRCVLNAVKQLRSRGIQVTIERLEEYLSFNKSSIADKLHSLRKRGFVEHGKNKRCDWNVVDLKKDSQESQ